MSQQPGSIYKDRMEVAYALADIINAEIKAVVAVGADFVQNRGNGHFAAAFKGIGRVAVAAAQVTAGQPNKCKWDPAQGRLALEAVENLGDQEVFKTGRGGCHTASVPQNEQSPNRFIAIRAP